MEGSYQPSGRVQEQGGLPLLESVNGLKHEEQPQQQQPQAPDQAAAAGATAQEAAEDAKNPFEYLTLAPFAADRHQPDGAQGFKRASQAHVACRLTVAGLHATLSKQELVC